MTDQEVKAYADTMFAQMGGKRFLFTTGTRIMCYGRNKEGNPYVLFRLPPLGNYLRGVKVRPNRYRITLDAGSDTYTVDYLRHVPAKMDFTAGKFREERTDVVYHEERIYCDQLQGIFEKQTGLLLDFCRVSFG